jgi:hypothetical protein
MNIGDVVLYTAFGRTLNAIVFGINVGDTTREGADGEPILDLIYIDPARESETARKRIGWEPTVVKDYGVVHASHEFSPEHIQAHGMHTPHALTTARGQGEWSEISSEELKDGWVNAYHKDPATGSWANLERSDAAQKRPPASIPRWSNTQNSVNSEPQE